MRDIKLRAWGEQSKTWLDWTLLGKPIRFDDDDPDRVFTFKSVSALGFIVSQFTGLKDKHGVEIYEGDIVDCAVFLWDGSDKPYKGVVVWHEGEYQIWPNPDTEFWGNDGSPSLYHTVTNDDESEVIGNIYENPELLKEAV